MKIPSRDVAPQSNFRPTEANSECSFAPCGTRDAVLVDVVEHLVCVVYGFHALVSRIFLQPFASVDLCIRDVIFAFLQSLQEIESVLNGRRYVNLQVGNTCNFFFGHRLFSVLSVIVLAISEESHCHNVECAKSDNKVDAHNYSAVELLDSLCTLIMAIMPNIISGAKMPIRTNVVVFILFLLFYWFISM